MTPATTDWELYEIYRKKAVRAGIDRILAEDVAQECFAIALYNERARGISRFKQTFKWLFRTAWRRCVFKDPNRDKSGWVKLHFGYHPFYGQNTDNAYLDFTLDMYEQWLCSIWASTSNRDGSRYLKRYRVTANDIEIELTGAELKELLGKEHLNISDGNFASNLKKRGKRMWLINGDLWRELGDACKFYGLSDKTLKKRFPPEPVKLFVK